MTTAAPSTSARGRFHERVVVVTGGGSGIGRAIVQRLAGEGARIAIVDWNRDAADGVAASLTAGGAEVLAFAADISQPQDVERAFADVRTRLGAIDVLVNNAAIAETDDVVETSWDGWQHDLAVSLGGPFLCSKAVLPQMIDRGGGVIVSIASVNAFTAIDNEAYSAAKAGIVSLTQMMATRYGKHGVRAVAVAPGAVRTEHPSWLERLETNPALFDELARWYPLGRIGEPDDVASAVLFLASDEAAWITGSTMVVDGGLLAGNQVMMREVLAQDAPAPS
ncbi:MAG TPA: glucose 1-dehydrogenase [Conexibacter sp.]|jgi:meso-butanediol dehydrogenase/(S,S)-butanediol dehydrogenase/diacetyl reductase|nr:glucose 1-dehydrogenase [Conexibacter sp.]